jgi:hypothetical protein
VFRGRGRYEVRRTDTLADARRIAVEKAIDRPAMIYVCRFGQSVWVANVPPRREQIARERQPERAP